MCRFESGLGHHVLSKHFFFLKKSPKLYFLLFSRKIPISHQWRNLSKRELNIAQKVWILGVVRPPVFCKMPLVGHNEIYIIIEYCEYWAFLQIVPSISKSILSSIKHLPSSHRNKPFLASICLCRCHWQPNMYAFSTFRRRWSDLNRPSRFCLLNN